MKRLDFLKDWYQKEDDRQTALNNSLSIPIGILTGLFAIIFFLTNEFSFKEEENLWISLLFILLISSSAISWLVVIYNLFISYNKLLKGYEYQALPFPSQLNEQYENLEKWYEENKDQLETSDTVDSIYENQLIEMFTDYLEINISNNDTKAKHLFIAKKTLLITIIIVVISAIPYTLNKILTKSDDKIHKVEIQNHKGFQTQETSKVNIQNSIPLNSDIQQIEIINIDSIKYINSKYKSDSI